MEKVRRFGNSEKDGGVCVKAFIYLGRIFMGEDTGTIFGTNFK